MVVKCWRAMRKLTEICVVGCGVWQGGNGQSSVYGEGLVDLMNASLYI